jgi:hypothetical protein
MDRVGTGEVASRSCPEGGFVGTGGNEVHMASRGLTEAGRRWGSGKLVVKEVLTGEVEFVGQAMSAI